MQYSSIHLCRRRLILREGKFNGVNAAGLRQRNLWLSFKPVCNWRNFHIYNFASYKLAIMHNHQLPLRSNWRYFLAVHSSYQAVNILAYVMI